MSKLKVNAADRNTYSELFQKVAFSNLSINVISEKFRMNLAFTIAIILFLSPYFIGGDIFGFSSEDGESEEEGEEYMFTEFVFLKVLSCFGICSFEIFVTDLAS